jgi:hypothetical protein
MCAAAVNPLRPADQDQKDFLWPDIRSDLKIRIFFRYQGEAEDSLGAGLPI